MSFYCFLVKEITKLAEIFTGWFYYISLDFCKVWKHLQTLYQWALIAIYHYKLKYLQGVLVQMIHSSTTSDLMRAGNK